MIQKLCLLLCLAPSLILAEINSGEMHGVHFATQENGLSVFQTPQTEWVVQCQGEWCVLTSDWVQVLRSKDAVYLLHEQQGDLVHLINRSSQTLPIGKALDVFESATLLSGGRLTVIAQDEASLDRLSSISLSGLAVVLAFADRQLETDQPLSDTNYRALADARRSAGASKLLPFTKPQIEFAIQAQQSAELNDQ